MSIHDLKTRMADVPGIEGLTIGLEAGRIVLRWDRYSAAVDASTSDADCSKIIQLNWTDNPFFPKILNTTRLDDLKNRPDEYEWVWGGGFRTFVKGAYYSKPLIEAKSRIDFVPLDPLMQVRAYFDIGGTGARADAVAIWVCQFVGQKINVLDYYEAQGQELSVHLAWLRSRGWGKAWCVLPHDGAHGDKVFATSYESAIREAGFDVFVIPNQGQGAASPAPPERCIHRCPSSI